jgi:pimeloyl-ACP methyl ester carboxylesterase
MSSTLEISGTRPEWLNPQLYPFAPHYLPVPAGRLHYLDEGEGSPVVMVHGTPAWSFLYRHWIRELSPSHRCIVPDHLGFGLSDKPAGFAYTPAAHADNLTRLLEHLQLDNITLVVHDFGGPIGLAFALRHPERIRRVVVLNSWLWNLSGEKTFRRASSLFSSWLGRLLYTRFNFSAKVLLKSAFHDKNLLPPEVHWHYTAPLATPSDRLGTWRLAGELIGSGPWFEKLWEQREKLAGKPMLLLWGVKDQLIPERFLAKWEKGFPQTRVVRLECGHFAQEEKPREALTHLSSFLDQT